MAFNLNKNEPTDPSTRFDLSKKDLPTVAGTPQEKSRSATWLVALIGVLVIGIAAWFFLSESNSASGNENVTATTSTSPSPINDPALIQNEVAATTADTSNQVKAENTDMPNTAAPTVSNATVVPVSSNSNQDRTSAAGFNNSIPVKFAKGSAYISKIDQSLVKDLVIFLEKNPDAFINVNGYASSEGVLEVNQQISQSRADAFKKHLVSKGIPASRINSTGKGIQNPIASNDTEEGRIENRRIEISIR